SARASWSSKSRCPVKPSLPPPHTRAADSLGKLGAGGLCALAETPPTRQFQTPARGRRRAVGRMVPKNKVPDAIRGGYRFLEIMRISNPVRVPSEVEYEGYSRARRAPQI